MATRPAIKTARKMQWLRNKSNIWFDSVRVLESGRVLISMVNQAVRVTFFYFWIYTSFVTRTYIFKWNFLFNNSLTPQHYKYVTNSCAFSYKRHDFEVVLNLRRSHDVWRMIETYEITPVQAKPPVCYLWSNERYIFDIFELPYTLNIEIDTKNSFPSLEDLSRLLLAIWSM